MYDLKLSGGLQLVKNTVEVNIKKLVPEATIPRYAKTGDAGLDLVCTSMTETDLYIEYGTGIAIQLPSNYYAAIVPRSSISKYHLILANSPGTVDSGYTGEIMVRFKKSNNGPAANYYKIGDRVAQMIVQKYPTVLFTEVSELESTDRGTGGFGSSGK